MCFDDHRPDIGAQTLCFLENKERGMRDGNFEDEDIPSGSVKVVFKGRDRLWEFHMSVAVS